MKRTLYVLAVVIAGYATAAAAQNRAERLALALRDPGCKLSEQTTCGADMRAVQAALASPAAAWEFITSPGTGYFERRVAAARAGATIPVEWLPRLFAAQQELEMEEHLHRLEFK